MDTQDKLLKVRLKDSTMADGRVSSVGESFTSVVVTVHGSQFAVNYANATVERAVKFGLHLQA